MILIICIGYCNNLISKDWRRWYLTSLDISDYYFLDLLKMCNENIELYVYTDVNSENEML
jgi:hypothetical protein